MKGILLFKRRLVIFLSSFQLDVCGQVLCEELAVIPCWGVFLATSFEILFSSLSDDAVSYLKYFH